ncbi:biotin carboxylase [Bacillus sp. AFS076308]|uniref:ATP-grasp domain-containing protein n=1 Tax=unclassified Bacillus (in: firmicutes) TaxID=185979 RepID=UPI000BF94870|nr:MULTISPECIES: ATP-grasp domain-containing protein [unclassified Bacillus (in: firmicutes)]PFO03359.1 biotin carboxylase [Bacillus sp. AFS076308]PGV50040.1 biotin carboxylase [Bacillus sp. AFS037270]
MRTIVFIETNKSGSSREAIKAAERLGYFTVLFTNKQKFIHQRTEFPDVHQMILVDLSNYDELRKNLNQLQQQGKQIKGILSFVHSYVHLAAGLAEEFCTSIVSTDSIFIMENKVLTRELLKGHPNSPHYALYNPDDFSLEEFIDQAKDYFPLIVKCPTSAGSKDVMLANNEDQLKLALQDLLKKHEQILLEEYLEGPQYLIEVLVHNGKVHIVAIIEQQITLFQRFIVTGYCLLPNINQRMYNRIFETVSSILQAFQMRNGACHLEMRLVNGEWKIIEINPRISGGAMNRIIEVGYGINLVEETIQLMLGNEPCLTKKHSKYVYAHYLTVDSKGKLSKVTGKELSSQYPGVEEVYIKPRKGQIVRPPLSMGDRCGYILASSSNKIEAKRMAIRAASNITFYLDPL